MGSGQPRSGFGLFGLILTGISSVSAAVAILDYFEVRPKHLISLAYAVSSALKAPPAPPGPTAPARPTETRPARLVLILDNVGTRDDLKHVKDAAARVAERLLPGDRVSLITISLDEEPVWLFRELPGDQARVQTLERLKGLSAVHDGSIDEARDDAGLFLAADPIAGHGRAVFVVTAAADRGDVIDGWFRKVREVADPARLVLQAAARPAE